MTDRLALILALIVLALIGFDLVLNDGTAVMFLIRKLFELIEHLRFWS